MLTHLLRTVEMQLVATITFMTLLLFAITVTFLKKYLNISGKI